MKQHNYFIYIVTNPSRTVLYTGVTNNLEDRLYEHYLNKGNGKTFAGRYYCYNLLHFERFQFIQHAIAREKEIKGWDRAKKIELIKTENAELKFLNEDVCEKWPPPDGVEIRQTYN
jgi:putative endonuclease